MFEDYIFKISTTSPRGNGLKLIEAQCNDAYMRQ